MSLVLTNLFWAKLVGRAMKILREIMDDPNVGFCGTMRVITSLEFLQHHFAKMGHRDLLVTHNLFQRVQLPFSGSRARGSVRRASGFVQIAVTLTIRLIRYEPNRKELKFKRERLIARVTVQHPPSGCKNKPPGVPIWPSIQTYLQVRTRIHLP